jgi:hypothetical protein
MTFFLTQTQSFKSCTDPKNHNFIPLHQSITSGSKNSPCMTMLQAFFSWIKATKWHIRILGLWYVQWQVLQSFHKTFSVHRKENKPQYRRTYFHDVNTLLTWRAPRVLTQVAIPCTMTPFMKVHSVSAEWTHFCACSRFMLHGLDPHHNTGHQSISPETSPMLSCTW